VADVATTARRRGEYANTARRKAEIVEAAERAFAVAGYHGGSLRQIARDLNLSFTSLRHHVPSKEALLIAVLEADVAYGHFIDIADCPKGLVDRLKHYFLSYKQLPNEAPRRVEIADVYDRAEAAEVINRSVRDYRARYGAPEARVGELKRLLR
jgi:AcrR family transcriptional regulator